MLVASVLVAAGFVWGAQSSLAVHDTGMFELDGNIVHNSASTPPYDWANLFGAGGTKLITPDPDNGPVLASTFVDDTDAIDTSYFAGGTKIDAQIHNMGCGGPAANDKTSMDYVYAALIQVPATAADNAGHQVLYLALEKQAAGNGGDNAFGFWLYKDNTVGCNAAGTAKFTGGHTDGDLFIDGTFTNGGGASDVEVRRWNGNDTTGALGGIVNTGNVCGVVANDDVCGIANTGTITSGAWRSSGTMAANTFVEAGIDMSAVLGSAGGCFSTFLADSQSSQSTDSQPKDYAGGQFNTCVPPSIDTTATPGGSLNPTGVATQHDVATMAAVGGRPAPTGSVTFSLCKPSEVTSGGCATGGTQVGGAVTINAGSATSANASGALTTTTGKYCWRAEYVPDSAASSFYVAGSETNAISECFTVVHGTPTIATQEQHTGTPPGVGLTALTDTAHLSGFVGSVAGETISFNLYGPFASGVPPVCNANTVVAAAARTGTLNAAGNATTTASYTPTAAGTFVWVASYPGDTLNDPIAEACNGANESVTVLGAQIDVAKSANPPGPVSAGATIGFDLKVTNDGAVPALGVNVHDVLPSGADGVSGGDLNWQLDPAYTNCAITGALGSQVLNCALGQVDGPGSLPLIHISSPTTQFDCGTVKNKATITTTNGTGTDSDVATVTVLCPNLAITKSADAASVTVGNPIGFHITATNNGLGSASGVLVNDPLPTGPGIVWSVDGAGTTGPLSCSIVTNVLKCTGVLASGASEIVHITSPTQWTGGNGTPVVNSCLGGPNGDGTYNNTAQVSATNATNSPSDGASEQVLCPDLGITKKADASSVNAGSTIGFVITATNGGLGSASGALISDTLPHGVTWGVASATGPLTCGILAGTLTCTGTLTSGQSQTVHITAPTTFADCGLYDNTATLTATNTPQAPHGSDSTSVLCANVVIHKTADAASVSVGAPIGFTVSITNSGSGAANGVDVEDPLPAGSGVNWSVDTSTGPLTCVVSGSPPSQTLKCTGNLSASGSAGDSQSAHVTSSTVWNADHKSCGVYDNTATIVWNNGPANPISSELATETVLCPDLAITKTADDNIVSAGSAIGFTIVVTNAGAGTARNVTLSDPLPAGTDVGWSIDSAGPALGTCIITGAVGSQTLACSFGDLPTGAVLTIHITSDTTAASCGGYDNTATLHSTNEPGIAPGSDSTTVQCPDVTFTKTADHATVNAGEQIGFIVKASNSAAAGTGTATSVVINDPLPGGTGISWSIVSGPGNCTISGTAPQLLHCTPVDLAPGDSESVHIVSATAFDSCAKYSNEAALSGSNVGPVTADADTTVQCPSLTFTKVADHGTVDAGSQIGFTVSVSNGGPGDAVGVVVNDPLPSGSGVSWSIESGPGNCSITGTASAQTLHCTPVTLSTDDSEVIHVISGTAFASCGTYHNTATLTAANAPGDSANADVEVQCSILTLIKTADKTPVDAGDQIGFTITASNSDAVGTGTAHGVVLDDPLPVGAGVDWSLDSGPANCSITSVDGAQTLHCTPIDLAAGESVSAHVVSGTEFASCATLPNKVTLSATNHPTMTADASVTVQCPTLTLVKSADEPAVRAGSSIGFTLSVSNTGPGTAKSAKLADALPAGSDVDWSIDPAYDGMGTCVINGAVGSQTLNCAFGALAAADTASVHVSSSTTAASCTTYPNSATLSATNHPNVVADATTTVQCPHTSLVKTADAATVDAGDQIGFTVTASNSDVAGTGTATGVVITDPLPGGPGINWSIKSGPENCSVTGTAPTQTLTCTAIEVLPGATESVHVVSGTVFDSCGTYDNTATLTLTNGAAPDPASATTEVQCSSLALTKVADRASVTAGQQIGFTISATNGGPGIAHAVAISDPLPSGDGISWELDDAVSAAEACAIDTAAGKQVLNCLFGDLDSEGSVSVHVVSSTIDTSCGAYHNVASLSAGNAPALTAEADASVITCLGTEAEPLVTQPVAVTGAGPVQAELIVVLVLLCAGSLLLVLGRRRRRDTGGWDNR